MNYPDLITLFFKNCFWQ